MGNVHSPPKVFSQRTCARTCSAPGHGPSRSSDMKWCPPVFCAASLLVLLVSRAMPSQALLRCINAELFGALGAGSMSNSSPGTSGAGRTATNCRRSRLRDGSACVRGSKDTKGGATLGMGGAQGVRASDRPATGSITLWCGARWAKMSNATSPPPPRAEVALHLQRGRLLRLRRLPAEPLSARPIERGGWIDVKLAQAPLQILVQTANARRNCLQIVAQGSQGLVLTCEGRSVVRCDRVEGKAAYGAEPLTLAFKMSGQRGCLRSHSSTMPRQPLRKRQGLPKRTRFLASRPCMRTHQGENAISS